MFFVVDAIGRFFLMLELGLFRFIWLNHNIGLCEGYARYIVKFSF